MNLSVHVLDVPAFVLVHTPHQVIVVVPAGLDACSLQALESLLLSEEERAALEQSLREHPGVPPRTPSSGDPE
jgi:hypothetical protein